MRRPYIKPPRSEDCEWRSGPPPGIGWWPASIAGKPDPRFLRWWNGKHFSLGVRDDCEEWFAGATATVPNDSSIPILWTDRWWETRK